MTKEKIRAETERDADSAHVMSCTRERLWRKGSTCNLQREMHFDSTKRERERELDKFPNPRAISGIKTKGLAVLFVHSETMIAITVNLAIYGICSHSKLWPERTSAAWQEREGTGREASGTVRTRPSSAPLPPPPPRRFAAGDRLCTYVRRTYWKRRHLAQMTIWDSETWRRGELKSE